MSASFDPRAKCPLWLKFLDRITGGDEALQRFLQQAIGYCLTGDTREQCLFIAHGSGANGKTTFINTVAALFGDYATQTPIETLMVKRNESVGNDVARLKGARFVSATEVEEGKRLAESLVKALSGGDEITARFLYGEFFTFIPEFKLFLGTNHKPQIRGTDHAIWRRIRLIPFEVTIGDDEKDPLMGQKLKAELDGILSWAVEGCRHWQEEGLEAPEKVTSAVFEYRAEMDLLSAFFDRCCHIEANALCRSSDLYERYRIWSEIAGEHRMSQRKLSDRMKGHGFDSVRRNDGRYWLGVGLLDEQKV